MAGADVGTDEADQESGNDEENSLEQVNVDGTNFKVIP